MIKLTVLLAILLMLSLLGNLYLSKWVLFPLRDLTARTADLAEGDFTSMQMLCDSTARFNHYAVLSVGWWVISAAHRLKTVLIQRLWLTARKPKVHAPMNSITILSGV